MKRFFLAVAAMALAAAPALAATTQSSNNVLGATLTPGATASPLVAPTCPKGVSAANCTIVLTQSTALETIRDGTTYPTTITQAGQLVAWSVGLSRLSSNDTTAHKAIHFLDQTYHGTTQVGIAVLKPVGAKSKNQWQLVAQSPIVHVQPWLGYVVQFPLATPIPVQPGEVVALTVPTWAPVLTFDLTS
jgi:hypothetical protein